MSPKFKIVLAIVFVAIAVYMGFRNTWEDFTGPTVRIGETAFVVEIADTPEFRTQGLSDRPYLAKGRGMLFIFNPPSLPSFWMKDMQFPLDIIWIREGRVAGTSEDLPPALNAAFPPVYTPPTLVDYVLEVNAGEVARYNIKAGDPVEIQD